MWSHYLDRLHMNHVAGTTSMYLTIYTKPLTQAPSCTSATDTRNTLTLSGVGSLRCLPVLTKSSGSFPGDVPAAVIQTVCVCLWLSACGRPRPPCLTWLGEAPPAAQPCFFPPSTLISGQHSDSSKPRRHIITTNLCRAARPSTQWKELDGKYLWLDYKQAWQCLEMVNVTFRLQI